METIVTNKEELKAALAVKAPEIMIIGAFAQEVKESEKIRTMSKVGICALCAAVPIVLAGLALTSVSGGASTVLKSIAKPVVGLTGPQLAVIIPAAAMGFTAMIAVLRDYDEVEFSPGKLVLRRKSKK